MKNFLLFHMENILEQYFGDIPLAHFLKQYFKKNPKLGSRDRRSLTEGAYVYYRIAPFVPRNSTNLETLFHGLQVCNSTNNFLLDSYQKSGIEYSEKKPVSLENWKYFYHPELQFSQGVEVKEWLQSMLSQPDLFIRIRKNFISNQEKLQNSGLIKTFEEKEESLPHCFRLENGSKVESILPSEDYVVQDWASQTSMDFLLNRIKDQNLFDSQQTVWDVCAGSGGKSIYWKDARPQDFLVATDIRQSILNNLKERFSRYRIERFKTMVLNAESQVDVQQKVGKQSFPIIVCDVPCSGSGTWARTPEQFYFFEIGSLHTYAKRQFQIAFEAQKHLKPSGIFAYITCSVFQQENENVVKQLVDKTPLKLISQKSINGISRNADHLFIALLTK